MAMCTQYRLKAVVGIWSKRYARKFIAEAHAGKFVTHYTEENRGVFMSSVFTLWFSSDEARSLMHIFLRTRFSAITRDTF